jgi:DNA-binding CsgD family transcriptional regulator
MFKHLASHVRGINGWVDLRFLGVSTPFFFSGLFSKTFLSTDMMLYFYFQLCLALFLFVFAAVAVLVRLRRISALPSVKIISIVSSCSLLSAQVLLAIDFFLPVNFLLYPIMLLGGFGLCCSYLQWFMLLSLRPAKSAFTMIALSFALSSLLWAVLSYLSSPMVFFLAALFAIVSHLLFSSVFIYSRSKTPRFLDFSAHDRRQSQSLLWNSPQNTLLLLGGLFVLSFVLSFMRAPHVENQHFVVPGALSHVLCIGLALLLVFLIVFRHRTLSVSLLCFSSTFLVVASVFVVSLFSGTDLVLPAVVAAFMREAVALLLFLILTRYAQNIMYHPAIVVGVGYGVYALAQSFGIFVYAEAGFYPDEKIVLNVIYLALMIGVLWLAYVNLKAVKGATGLLLLGTATNNLRTMTDSNIAEISSNPAIIGGSPEEAIPLSPESESAGQMSQPESCGAVSLLRQSYKLTEREVEIVELICQGRTKRYISEKLFISENTVRGHVKNIHIKCGIHNKQQLINILENAS